MLRSNAAARCWGGWRPWKGSGEPPESLRLWVSHSLARLSAIMAPSARHSGQAELRPARDGGRDGLYRIPSLDLLPTLLGVQPRIQLAFMEGSICCKRRKDLHSKRSEH